MTSQASSSDENQSAGFFKLHEAIRKWIYEQKWDELREIQELAVDPILGKERDVILAAPTAAGKTEAAFLPICSVLLTERKPSIEAVYIGPLKALINDQFERLETLCERLQIPVCKWHGDVSTNAKSRLLGSPQGILLITPESLEALFMRRGSAIPSLFKHVSHLVIDELHAFIGAERGAQLQSLLHRLEHAVDRRIPRIGLSATLGNMGIAAEFFTSTIWKRCFVGITRRTKPRNQVADQRICKRFGDGAERSDEGQRKGGKSSNRRRESNRRSPNGHVKGQQ